MASLNENLKPVTGNPGDYDDLLRGVGDAEFVLLGEASHGTHEFYRERALLTQLLIEQKGFTAVAVEADWPDAYRVNRYVQNACADMNPNAALGDFSRFPQWMWRNTDVVNFISWLHEYNKRFPEGKRVGFYGVDLYSLYTSIDAVVRYLEKIDPQGAAAAKHRYACFDHFNRDSQSYGMHAGLGYGEDCEKEVLAQLMEMRRSAADYLRRDGFVAQEELFFAEQNAVVVSNAEKYYRSMFWRHTSSWNIRDRHMAETVDRLAAHLQNVGQAPKIAVWAHNSHLGDARATDQARRGELNLGQLIREQHSDRTVAIGFSTYAGSVTATSEWDQPAQHKRVRPGLPGSYEELFHKTAEATGHPDYFVKTDAVELHKPRLQRAIGVIYRPDTERWSHYYEVDLARQFDWMIHFDKTHAVEPLEKGTTWHPGPQEDVPEAYPTGI